MEINLKIRPVTSHVLVIAWLGTQDFGFLATQTDNIRIHLFIVGSETFELTYIE